MKITLGALLNTGNFVGKLSRTKHSLQLKENDEPIFDFVGLNFAHVPRNVDFRLPVEFSHCCKSFAE